MNTNAYIETILTPALQAAKKHFKDKPFIFQQDGAPSHMSKKTQKWCQDHFPQFWSEEVCPPDLNPMDFCVWSLLEADAVLLLMCQLKPSRVLLRRHGQKYPKKPCVKQQRAFMAYLSM